MPDSSARFWTAPALWRFFVLLPTIALTWHAAANSLFHDFVTVRGDQLYSSDRPFRFISFDIPNLLLIEDNVPFTCENPWRLPNRFEISDALRTVSQMGGTVARTYVITVRRTNDAADVPRHVLAPGTFNEQAFRAMDEVLNVANQTGVRLIVPLVDNWSWMGGRAEYAGFRGKTPDAFWTDPQVISDFKKTIHFVVTRRNSITGVRYCDDRAILCWETGNELASPATWTREIAAYIKSLDRHHLVMDGFNASVIRRASLEMPEIDLVTTHHYPGVQKSFADLIRSNRETARGRKPYVIGEFGFLDTQGMVEAMQAIVDSGASGGLLWSLRFHDRDGGFYWHSEPHGANLYKAFHWPGSPLGDPYDETKLIGAVRRFAFQIRGMSEPPIPAPESPTLLPIRDAASISWRGSVGAAIYRVERAPRRSGPWRVVATNVNESFVQYRPAFADEDATAGEWFYRVSAENGSGVSKPSNVVGPVDIKQAVKVDELADLSRTAAHAGHWTIQTRDCRKAKEDAHRAAGESGSALVYQFEPGIGAFRAFAFFPGEVYDLKCSVSTDGVTYRDISAEKEMYFQGAGDYGYWKPVLYRADGISGARFLKIELTGETQIGRVELAGPPLQR